MGVKMSMKKKGVYLLRDKIKKEKYVKKNQIFDVLLIFYGMK